MDTVSYTERRGELENYFDRTASDAWAKLTSDAPVSRVRATVRAGRDRMRGLIRGRLPRDLSGARILDAGCGTGTFSIELAESGAEVVAIDLSETLVGLAEQRAKSMGLDRICFSVGDMLNPALGRFDYIVAMDSIIHYAEDDMVDVVAQLTDLATKKVIVTFAPRTLPLSVMHFMGRFFPRGNRSPAIEPIVERRLRARLAEDERLASWRAAHSEEVKSGFYFSRLLELENVK